MIEHIYIHIPFCPNICPYCAFYKESAGKNRVEEFIRALCLEIILWSQQLLPKTIFMGGGTPSSLSERQLIKILESIHTHIDLSELQEWTIEMNPATVSEKKASILHDYSVNRISLGVQSWDSAVLKTLGRTHTPLETEESFYLLRSAGFKNISFDLIFSVPNQSMESWHDSLIKSLTLDPEHLSAYCLTYEEDTPFFQKLKAGIFHPQEDLEIQELDLTYYLLTQSGYLPYEISNYAKPGFMSLHNTAYWLGNDYLGVGPSAFSTVSENRWRNIKDTGIYNSSTISGKTATDFHEVVNSEILLKERLAFGLRLINGISVFDSLPWTQELEKFEKDGWIKRIMNSWVLTVEGRHFADSIAEIFF